VRGRSKMQYSLQAKEDKVAKGQWQQGLDLD
jgi:hypothetical protein